MKVLVTGGAGFIGHYLVERLVEENNEVVVLDNFSVGKRENLEKVLDKIKIAEADIRNFEEIKEYFKGIEAVFHLAAQSSVEVSVKNPLEDAETNALGTLNVLKACTENKVKKMVFFSSAAVYGDSKKFPLNEKVELRPLSPYGISKLAGESLCRVFSALHGIETIIFRTFNVYGKESAGVIGEFARKIKKSEPIVIYGNGKQTRDFLYVKDVVEACVLALQKESGKSLAETYNLAEGKETSINGIVEVFKKIADFDFKVIYEKPRESDIFRSWTDVSKIKKELGFEPKYTLEQGVNEIYEEL